MQRIQKIKSLNGVKQILIMEQLVERLVQKDPNAYKALYDLYAKPMYNLCYRLTNNESDAHDALQESFIRIFEKIDQLRQRELFSAWLKRIFTNSAIQIVKSRNKLRFEEFDDQPGMINLKDEAELCDESEFEKNIEYIKEGIENLPDRYRLVFTLYAVENYSHDEIAEMLGIVAGTSRSQYLRAKQKLIEYIQKNKHHERFNERLHSGS